MIALPPAAVATDSVHCDRVTAGRGDLGDHLSRGAGVGAVARQAAAGIVDDDLRAARRQQQRVRAARARGRRR